jgi:hypothetical protein
VLVIFEGHLSYEVPLVDVLRQVLDTRLAGPAVLQLADPMTGARGDILIENCQTLVGAQMYEPKAMGYPALRKLCEFALADYRLVQPDPAKANRGDHSLNLEIKQVMELIPHLPEDPSTVGTDPLERIFSNNGGGEKTGPVTPNLDRLDLAHATGGFEAVSVEMIQAARAENWHPLSGGKTVEKSMRQPKKPARAEFQTLSERMVDELAGSPAGAGDSEDENGQHGSKIKYRASNPFRDPKTFVLTIFSLFKLLLPRVILPALILVFLYQGGTYLYKNYKPQNSPVHEAHHQPVPAPVKNTVFQHAKPHVNTAPATAVITPSAPAEPPVRHAEPPVHHAETPVHHAEPVRPQPPALRPVAPKPPVKHTEVKHTERPVHTAARKPAEAAAQPAAKPAPASNEPIPEYKGPSSASGGEVKHRHAYQTLPSE